MMIFWALWSGIESGLSTESDFGVEISMVMRFTTVFFVLSFMFCNDLSFHEFSIISLMLSKPICSLKSP